MNANESSHVIAVWVDNKRLVAVRGDRAALVAEVMKQCPELTYTEAYRITAGRFISAY